MKDNVYDLSVDFRESSCSLTQPSKHSSRSQRRPKSTQVQVSEVTSGPDRGKDVKNRDGRNPQLQKDKVLITEEITLVSSTTGSNVTGMMDHTPGKDSSRRSGTSGRTMISESLSRPVHVRDVQFDIEKRWVGKGLKEKSYNWISHTYSPLSTKTSERGSNTVHLLREYGTS